MRSRFILAFTLALLVSLPAAAQVNPVYRQDPITGNATQQQQIFVPNGFSVEIGSGASWSCDAGASCSQGSPGTIPLANLQPQAATSTVCNPSGSSAVPIACSGTNALAGLGPQAANTVIGNNTGSSATPLALTRAQTWALLADPILSTTFADPTGTTSATGVMMGAGATCKYTPAISTRVEIVIEGSLAVSTTTGTAQAQLAWGTGSAPANGAAPAGTLVGPVEIGSPSSGGQVPYHMSWILSGLTLGTQFWFDVNLKQSGTVTASLKQNACTAKPI